MGYCIDVTINDVVIPAAKVPGAIKALLELMSQVDSIGHGGSWAGGRKTSSHFSWVSTEAVVKALKKGDLATALDEWRYECEDVNKDELEVLGDALKDYADVKLAYFTGEKLGQDEELWCALAPFVRKGGTMEFRGEDDARWRYVFDGEGMIEQTGKTVWEE